MGDLADFYEPMGMPIPNHNFMHFSWVGKTFAIGVLLIVGTFSRRFSLLLLALTIALIQQLSDLIIAQVLDVYVPITMIGLVLWSVSVALLGVHY